MHKKFDHKEIEKKWQDKWRETGIYNVEVTESSDKKEYVLVELPYPSGNLHIGHWYAFAVPDIYVRAHKMQGKKVLYPIGFDAFGLPAENAAIKRNLNPREWTESNIEYMKEQMMHMGNAFSWNTLLSTTDAEYYKWTQWMFTKFFENGIAYRGKGIVNWCPSCNTVLANEQVLANDTCERCGTEIEKKEMEEWKLRITKYADKLVDDLDDLEWPEPIKEAQRQWIGRKDGAEIKFTLSSGDKFEVFTTRPDTLYGATYVVFAPEHELIAQNKEHIENWEEVENYINQVKKKAERDRLDNTKEKTGVKLEGITASNPANGKELPVFIADYVLTGYGTGVIMAVPAHDERDFEFATKFSLQITEVISGGDALPFTEDGLLINSEEFDGMSSEEIKQKITEKVGGKMTNTYRLRDWSVGRQRYWGVPIPIVYDPEGNPHAVPAEHLPWRLPEDVDFRPTGEPPLAKSEELKNRTTEIFGNGWTPEVETMDTFVDSSWYFLRYIDNQNPDSLSSLEVQKNWLPIDIYFGGPEHTTMHLLYARFWQKALFDLGLVSCNEPFKKRINRGLILGTDGNKMSKSKGNVVDPDEQVENLGADSVRMYLAFMGPYGEVANYPFDLNGMIGQRRFLERVFGLQEHVVEEEQTETTKLLHKTIKKVSDDIEAFKFNTSISALMIFLNEAEKCGLSKSSYVTFLQLLAPFAPHISEELWSTSGQNGSIHTTQWPNYDKNLLVDENVTISVQINGKMKGTVEVPSDSAEDTVMQAIRTDEQLKLKVPSEVSKVIFVKNRIINLIGTG